MTVLSGTLVIVALLLAPYVRPWLAQRADLADGRAELSTLQQQVQQLTVERQRWNDPDYVRAQARERLHYVMPGETGFVVLRPTPTSAASSDPRSVAAALPGGDDGRVWYTKVWDSIQSAGTPASRQQVSSTSP